MQLGSLSNKDDNSSENIAKKIIDLRPFKLFRAYLEQLNLSNVGDFSWSWILKDFIQFKKRKDNSSSYVHVLHKSSN